MREFSRSAGLIVLLITVLASGCAGFGKGPTDQELIAGVLKEWTAALVANDLDKLMATFSENFSGDRGAGKDELREFLKGAIDQGYLEGAEVSMTDAVTTIDGQTATVSPVGLSGSYGALELELKLAKEADGVWRIVAADSL